MKTKIFLIVCLLLVSTVAFADDKQPEVRVEIKIVYNSVPIDKASEIHKKILSENKDACTVEVVTKKADNSIYVSTADPYYSITFDSNTSSDSVED